MPGAFLNVRRTARRAEDRMSGVIHPREEKFIAISPMKDITGVLMSGKVLDGEGCLIPAGL
jgi:hypothetical protein